MAVFKCKMCGGALEIGENQSIATCEYCGTSQTLPKLDNEKKLALFSRANNLRIKSEFDKAAGIYESIIAEFRDEAEAYWGLVLCKYGIEYVDDGKGKKIPTCHRTLPAAIMEDDDFQQACENADILAKNVYRDEAKAIDKIQKKILNIALNEEPYDIFICYKETDDITGARTEDSLIAQDIYTELIKDGYRVFFSRVSLREVAGTEYEPYIYAALSSAKIMLAIGTKHDYYDAVWVKNEWSRFISMMGDNTAKVLIPCFKNMDAYDIPKEFKNMQALDMGDVTFFGSLTESIERIIDKNGRKAAKETIILNNDNVDVAPLLERGFLVLEDKDWDKADEFFEAVLNKDPKNAKAYLGKLLADLEVSKFEKLSGFHTTFSVNKNYEKIMRFADEDLKEAVKNADKIIARRLEEARKKDLYENALEVMESATTEQMFENAGYMFIEVMDYLDAKEKSQECFELGETARKDTLLSDAEAKMKSSNPVDYLEAISLLEEIPDWKDAGEKISLCRKRIEEIKAKEEADRIERERREEEERKEQAQKAEEARKAAEAKAKKIKKLAKIITPIVAVVLVVVIVLTTVIIPNSKYNDAVALMEAGKYEEAIAAFEALDGAKDSAEKIEECNAAILDNKNKEAYALLEKKYNDAKSLLEEGKKLEALQLFSELYGHKDSATHISSILNDISVRETISAGFGHTIALKKDGSVIATKYIGKYTHNCDCNFGKWKDIVAVSAGYYHTVGLKSDGTVVAKGDNNLGRCEVDSWTDIVAISASSGLTMGLKSNGTVVTTKFYEAEQDKVSAWKGIVAISAGGSHAVGLKSDGSVVAVGSNDNGQCDVSDWTDIVAISAGGDHTVGLKSDGTVVATKYIEDLECYDKHYGQCDVFGWTDIVAISAGETHTVGLKSDGTIITTGNNANGQCNATEWKDIVAISAGSCHTVGLKSDGTVISTEFTGSSDEYIEKNYRGQCDVSDWKNIKLPKTNSEQ